MNASENNLFKNRGLNLFTGFFIFAIATLLLYSACDDANLITQTHELQAAKEQWEETNIEDYRVEVERICYCPAPFRYIMSVKNGEIVQILDSETGEATEQLAGYSTIDELFTWLEKVAAQNPQKLELEFHPELGYPAFIDYNQSDRIADEEMLMRVNNLKKQ